MSCKREPVDSMRLSNKIITNAEHYTGVERGVDSPDAICGISLDIGDIKFRRIPSDVSVRC
jgi:hypothetical protein